MLRKTSTKPFLLLFFIISSFSVKATTYYVSNSGNDNNSGTSSSSPWQTISKVNSFKKFAPGDNILFNSGNTFYGSIIIVNSGSSGSPITYGAYGSGAKPIITGFTNVSSWTNLGSNIWESSTAVSTLSTCYMVSVNGTNTAMGRYPNTGYLMFQSHNGNTSITSSSLSGSTNWAGASIAIKKQRWYIERGTITGQSGTTLSYTDGKQYTPQDGWGFFILNDPRTLDQQNEWYYNPSTKKLRIYSSSQPANVKLTTVENTFDNSANCKYITINNIAITGANSNLINGNYGQYATVTNCDLSYAGISGIDINSLAPTFIGNTINNTGYNGIYSHQNGVGGIIQNNIISNTGLIPGTPDNGGGAAIYSVAASTLIQGNVIDSSAWGGIVFYGNNSIVKNNFVNYSCLIKDDCGGIATHGGFTGQQIIGNIVLNSIGNWEGSSSTVTLLAHGIFLDDLSNSVTVSGNSVAGCGGVGYDFHRATNININNNTAYNNGTKGNWMKGAIIFQCDANNPPFTGIKLNNNIFVARTTDQLAFFYYLQSTNKSDITQFGTADSNYYARPIDDDSTILVNSSYYDTKGWQSYSSQDAHSKGSPKTITNLNDLIFEYNATSSTKTISLDAKYIDMKGTSYNGSITLAPFTSAVLIKNGALTQTTQNLLPAVNPANTVNGLDYNYYEASSYSVLPTFSSVTPVKTGTVTNFDISPANRTTSYSFNFTGYINVPTDGQYTFYTSSDDGSSLYIDNVLVVANDSLHGPTEKSGVIGLKAGKHAISVGYFQQSGGATLSVSYAGPGISKQVIPASALYRVLGTSLLPAVNPSNTVNGLNYSYYEAVNYDSLPSFTSLTPVKTGTTDNFDISMSARSTSFSFNFTGYINVPADGQYTFYTNSDDGSNLYIDNMLVVNNDGLHSPAEKSGVIGLKAGKHAISVGYFQQSGGTVLSVSYSGPGISKQAIPSSELYIVSTLLPAVNPANTVNGLNYNYYEAASYSVLPTFSSVTPVKTGTVTNFDISPANRSTSYSFNFTGYINVPADGQYTFYTKSDDGSSLYIDNVLVVNNDGLHSATEKSGLIGLKAGKHAISVGYFQYTRDQVLSVSYAGPGISKQAIPASALYIVSVSSSQRLGTSASAANVRSDSSSLISLDSSSLRANQMMSNSQIEPGIKVYPNPFSNSINISIDGLSGGKSQLLLFDGSGRMVWKEDINSSVGTYHKELNTSSFSNGIYFLKLIQENKGSIIKLVKQP